MKDTKLKNTECWKRVKHGSRFGWFKKLLIFCVTWYHIVLMSQHIPDYNKVLISNWPFFFFNHKATINVKSLILGYMGRRGCTFFKLCRGWLASDCGGSFIALCCIVHNANVCALGDHLGGSFFNFPSSSVLVLWVSIHYKWPSCFRESEFTVHVLGNELEMLQVWVFVHFSQFFIYFNLL